MGLQLRLTDSLGERLIELDARPASQPNVVGRGADAEVEVPSSGVSKRHCLLFVHEGRWVVRDGGSGEGTFVNGKRLTGAAYLETSDRITLGSGSKPPALVVDPHHVGVLETSEENVTPAAPAGPAVPRVAASPWSAPLAANGGPSLPPPVTRPMVAAPRGAAAPSYAGYSPPAAPQAPAADVPTGWEDLPPPTKQFYVPRRKKSSAGTFAVVAVLAVGIAVGGGYWIYTVYQKRIAENPPQVVIVKPAPASKPTSVFDFGQGGKLGATTRVAATQQVTRPAPTTTTGGMESSAEAPPDKRRQDPEWQEIEQARFEEPVLAIVKFNDYLERFPNSPYKKDLDQFTEEAVDRLWWKRLVELFQERDSAQKEIDDRRVQISQSQDAEFKKGLEAENVKFAERRDRADQTIRTQMKFTGQSPPNVYDSQDLAIGRANRDAAYYATWKEQVLSTIRHSRGQRLPWRSSR